MNKMSNIFCAYKYSAVLQYVNNCEYDHVPSIIISIILVAVVNIVNKTVTLKLKRLNILFSF